jgi:serine/threonine protein kinase
MELLQGEDMSKLRNRAKAASGIGLVALPAAVYLTRQMLACIRAIHERGFIHRDIKPANFVRRDRTGTEFCIIDFGLAKLYRDKSGNIRPKRATADFRGTTTYASLNVHLGEDQCPRDDLFSLIFVFCDLVCGKLPWTEAARDRNKHEVANLKMNLLGDPSKFVLWVHAIASSLRRPKEEVTTAVHSSSAHNGSRSTTDATTAAVAEDQYGVENTAGTISSDECSNKIGTVEEADDCNFPTEAKDLCLKIIKYLQSLSYEDTPDYDMIDQLFSECVKDVSTTQSMCMSTHTIWACSFNHIK